MVLPQQRFCLARSSNFTKLLDSVLKAEAVYVKGTGIRVLVTDIDYNKGQRSVHGRVKFLDVPTKKAVQMCEQVNIDVRENSRPVNTLGGGNQPTAQIPNFDITVNSIIDLDNLSTTPFETKAAKILYKKQK